MPNKPRKITPKRNLRNGPARQVRIIGGQWKRTPLPVLDADGLRPTPDRVRETVFNWLTHLLDNDWTGVTCLDLFAGTGALGFEAASRGAARVVMIEANFPAALQLEATKEKLHASQVTVMRGDALSVTQSLVMRHSADGSSFKLVFLDPPYHQDWLAKMLPVCAHLLAYDGLVYVESESPIDLEAPPAWLEGWEVVRADKAGMVFYHLLQSKNAG